MRQTEYEVVSVGQQLVHLRNRGLLRHFVSEAKNGVVASKGKARRATLSAPVKSPAGCEEQQLGPRTGKSLGLGQRTTMPLTSTLAKSRQGSGLAGAWLAVVCPLHLARLFRFQRTPSALCGFEAGLQVRFGSVAALSGRRMCRASFEVGKDGR